MTILLHKYGYLNRHVVLWITMTRANKLIRRYLEITGRRHSYIYQYLGISRASWQNYLTGKRFMTIEKFWVLQKLLERDEIHIFIVDFFEHN